MLSLTAGVPRWMFRPSGTGSYSSLWETPNGPRLSFLLVAVPMQICLGSRLLLCRVPPRLWASTSPTSVWSVDESLFVHLAAYPAGSAAARSSAAEAQRHARSIHDRTAALGMCRLFVLPCLEVSSTCPRRRRGGLCRLQHAAGDRVQNRADRWRWRGHFEAKACGLTRIPHAGRMQVAWTSVEGTRPDT